MKNKMNNKGCTLIELLAVVVILLAISVIAISSISAAIERNKGKQNEEKKLKRGYLICPTQDNRKRRHILKEASSYLYYDKKIINFFLFYNFF